VRGFGGGEEMTRIGQRKYLAWIHFCQTIGWRKSDMPRLAQLWLDYHDDNGEMK
jgi:hypothetical protein